MAYTLKLDWGEERIQAVCVALRHALGDWAGKPVVIDREQIQAALDDIDSSLITDTAGYCADCGKYIELVTCPDWQQPLCLACFLARVS